MLGKTDATAAFAIALTSQPTARYVARAAARNAFAQLSAAFSKSFFILLPLIVEIEPTRVIIAQGCETDMEMRNVWVGSIVFAPLPIQDWTANSFVVNYVFDSLIPSFGDFANLLN